MGWLSDSKLFVYGLYLAFLSFNLKLCPVTFTAVSYFFSLSISLLVPFSDLRLWRTWIDLENNYTLFTVTVWILGVKCKFSDLDNAAFVFRGFSLWEKWRKHTINWVNMKYIYESCLFSEFKYSTYASYKTERFFQIINE